MKRVYRRRLAGFVVTLLFLLAIPVSQSSFDELIPEGTFFGAQDVDRSQLAGPAKATVDSLDELEVKGRAPKTGYSRAEFGGGWDTINGCDTRERILARDLSEVRRDEESCDVLSGTLSDPYTGKTIKFLRGPDTSADVQIDHVVALSDAWQKGAQQLSIAERTRFSNDPLNLLAVDGQVNQQKGDGDAATWLPPNKSFRCEYVTRQVQVKARYSLWITSAEKSAITRELVRC